MRKALLFGATLVLLSSACARRPVTTTDRETDNNELRRDSSSTSRTYIEKVRLTDVEAAADEVPFTAQLEVNPATGKLKPTTYTSRGRRATVALQVDAEGKVTGKCGCEAEKATIASLDRELTQERSRHQEHALVRHTVTTHTVRVPVPYTTWYDYVARVLAGLLLLELVVLLLLYASHRLTKPKQSESNGAV